MQTNIVDYNQSASEYAAHRKVHAGVFRELCARSALASGSRVLEVGCGTGHYVAAVTEASGCVACGLDRSSEMLARVHTDRVRRLAGRAGYTRPQSSIASRNQSARVTLASSSTRAKPLMTPS